MCTRCPFTWRAFDLLECQPPPCSACNFHRPLRKPDSQHCTGAIGNLQVLRVHRCDVVWCSICPAVLFRASRVRLLRQLEAATPAPTRNPPPPCATPQIAGNSAQFGGAIVVDAYFANITVNIAATKFVGNTATNNATVCLQDVSLKANFKGIKGLTPTKAPFPNTTDNQCRQYMAQV